MRHATLTLLTGLGLALATAAWSAGGGGGGNFSAATERVQPRAKQDPDFQAAMAAVKAGDWQQVVQRMGAFTARIADNADAYNELGHAWRQLGEMDKAFAQYELALKLDPKHRGAREYLGEAYLQLGDLARAEQQLAELDSLCFFPCEEYTELKQKIAQYKAARAKPAG